MQRAFHERFRITTKSKLVNSNFSPSTYISFQFSSPILSSLPFYLHLVLSHNLQSFLFIWNSFLLPINFLWTPNFYLFLFALIAEPTEKRKLGEPIEEFESSSPERIIKLISFEFPSQASFDARSLIFCQFTDYTRVIYAALDLDIIWKIKGMKLQVLNLFTSQISLGTLLYSNKFYHYLNNARTKKNQGILQEDKRQLMGNTICRWNLSS